MVKLKGKPTDSVQNVSLGQYGFDTILNHGEKRLGYTRPYGVSRERHDSSRPLAYYSCRSVQSGLLGEAAKLNYEQPALILINWRPPKRTGFEILKKIKSGRLATSIPAVVLGSSSDNKYKEKCVALGARYYTKPNTFDELLSTVRSVCALVQQV